MEELQPVKWKLGWAARLAPALLSVGLIVWLEGVVTIEWTYPYCLDRSDGPAYAAHGMPLPYWMWNGVSSLEHDFVPHIYILNILLLCIVVFPIVRWVINRNIFSSPWLRTSIAVVGAVLLCVHIALMLLMIWMKWFNPTTSLGSDNYRRYSDFRPVRIGFRRSNAPDCIPSSFWFPDGWRHN